MKSKATSYDWLLEIARRQQLNDYNMADVPREVIKVLKQCRCIAFGQVITAEGMLLITPVKQLVSSKHG